MDKQENREYYQKGAKPKMRPVFTKYFKKRGCKIKNAPSIFEIYSIELRDFLKNASFYLTLFVSLHVGKNRADTTLKFIYTI